MTHIRPMADEKGDFGEWERSVVVCIYCSPAKDTVQVRGWHSHDGAYEDSQYRCTGCGHTWWVDGDDG